MSTNQQNLNTQYSQNLTQYQLFGTIYSLGKTGEKNPLHLYPNLWGCSEFQAFLSLHKKTLKNPNNSNVWCYTLQPPKEKKDGTQTLPNSGAIVAYSPSTAALKGVVRTYVLPRVGYQMSKTYNAKAPSEPNLSDLDVGYVLALHMLQGPINSSFNYLKTTSVLYKNVTFTLTQRDLTCTTLYRLAYPTTPAESLLFKKQRELWREFKVGNCFGRKTSDLVRQNQGLCIIKTRTLAEIYAERLLKAARYTETTGDLARELGLNQSTHGDQAYSAWSFVLNGLIDQNNINVINRGVLQALALNYVSKHYKTKTSNINKPTKVHKLLSAADLLMLIDWISTSLNINNTTALSLIYSFFICGGQNKSVDPYFSVSIRFENRWVYLNSQFLLEAYNACFAHKATESRVRTIGESLGLCIGEYAAQHQLHSELSAALNTLSIAIGCGPLSDLEKSYSLSIMDKNLQALSVVATPHLAALVELYTDIKLQKP